MQNDPYGFEHSQFQRDRLIKLTRKRGITSDEPGFGTELMPC